MSQKENKHIKYYNCKEPKVLKTAQGKKKKSRHLFSEYLGREYVQMSCTNKYT